MPFEHLENAEQAIMTYFKRRSDTLGIVIGANIVQNKPAFFQKGECCDCVPFDVMGKGSIWRPEFWDVKFALSCCTFEKMDVWM